VEKTAMCKLANELREYVKMGQSTWAGRAGDYMSNIGRQALDSLKSIQSRVNAAQDRFWYPDGAAAEAVADATLNNLPELRGLNTSAILSNALSAASGAPAEVFSGAGSNSRNNFFDLRDILSRAGTSFARSYNDKNPFPRYLRGYDYR